MLPFGSTQKDFRVFFGINTKNVYLCDDLEYKLRKGLGNDKILKANALRYEVHLKEQEAIALMEAVIEGNLLNFKYKKSWEKNRRK